MLTIRPATKLALLAIALCCAEAAAQAPFKVADGSGSEAAEMIRRRPPDTSGDARIEAARRRALAARKAFEDARDNSTPDDWVYVNPEKNPLGMRRFPRPEYEARLKDLERQARQAQEELERLERSR